jgi:hypothetical protein
MGDRDVDHDFYNRTGTKKEIKARRREERDARREEHDNLVTTVAELTIRVDAMAAKMEAMLEQAGLSRTRDAFDGIQASRRKGTALDPEVMAKRIEAIERAQETFRLALKEAVDGGEASFVSIGERLAKLESRVFSVHEGRLGQLQQGVATSAAQLSLSRLDERLGKLGGRVTVVEHNVDVALKRVGARQVYGGQDGAGAAMEAELLPRLRAAEQAACNWLDAAAKANDAGAMESALRELADAQKALAQAGADLRSDKGRMARAENVAHAFEECIRGSLQAKAFRFLSDAVYDALTHEADIERITVAHHAAAAAGRI